jgi:hypothetical protein
MELDIMNKKKLTRKLMAAGFNIVQHSRIANDTGWRFDLNGGVIVNLFDTGNMNVQGRNPEQIQIVKEYLGKAKGSVSAKSQKVVLVWPIVKSRTKTVDFRLDLLFFSIHPSRLFPWIGRV